MQATIKNAMPTGKTDQKFGTEYYVQFNEMADTAKLWFQKQPDPGATLELEKGKYGWKKVKKEWSPNQSAASHGAASAGTPTARSASKPAYNQDGMRQGMCINNAANYVNSLEFSKAMTDHEWATMVYAYATALYALGDLKATEPETVGDLYNVQ